MIGRVLVLLLAILGSACAARPAFQRADIVIADAHGGSQALTFNRQGDLLASGGWAGDLKLWNPVDGTLQHTWQAHTDAISAINFGNDDSTLLTASYDAHIALWDAQGRQLARQATPAAITDMQFDRRHNRVFTAHTDGVLRQWRLPTLEAVSEQQLHDGAIHSLALHAPSNTIASSGEDRRVLISTDHKHWRELPAPPADAHSLAFAPDGNTLLGSGWYRLFRWEMANGTLKVFDTEHSGQITDIEFSADGSYLASISRQFDSAVLFLDPNNGAVLRRFQPHELCGADVALSPGQRFLATTSDDASIMIWDMQTRQRAE